MPETRDEMLAVFRDYKIPTLKHLIRVSKGLKLEVLQEVLDEKESGSEPEKPLPANVVKKPDVIDKSTSKGFTEEPEPEIKSFKMLTKTAIKKKFRHFNGVFEIPIKDIQIIPGFNVRQDYGDIEGLATNIKQNGQLTPARVDITEEGVFLIQGHRRLRALNMIDEIDTMICIVNEGEVTEEDHLIQMYSENDGKKLEAIEQAVLFKRMVDMGYTVKRISMKLGVSQQTVYNYLKLNELSPEELAAMARGEVTKSSKYPGNASGKKSGRPKVIRTLEFGLGDNSYTLEAANKKYADTAHELIGFINKCFGLEMSLVIHEGKEEQ